jgi:hypothetical protein
MTGAFFFGVGVSAAATTTPAAGIADFFITPGSGGGGTIVVTGAIGDYGKVTPMMDKNGKTDKKGNYGKMILKKGTIEADLTMFVAKEQSLGSGSSINTATCSMTASATAPVTLFNGTGLYKGITGTVNLTVTFAVVLPRYTSGKNKGQCNESSNANPVAQSGTIAGSGNVSF